ncbi:MAG: hypothetical protein WC809_04910 [Sinimarinibacterium sp.]
MKSPIVLSCIVLLAACASPAKKDSDAAPKAEAMQAQADQPRCLQETGSHVSRSEDRPCVAAPGQVYTREDIDRTGATTTGDALRKLSPSVH